VLTTLEAGIPNSDYNFWVGMMVPAKTPREIVAKLAQHTLQALRAPDMQERMAKIGAEPMLMTTQEFDAYIRREIGTNATLVKAAGITVN
jgi:tripartite-type tricarboxylate transporter receptor subunit TctC